MNTFYQSEDMNTQKWIDERLKKINNCLLSLGNNPGENLNKLVIVCGELLTGYYAFYHRLEEGTFRTIGQWNTPLDYQPPDRPNEYICYDVICRGEEQPVVVYNLHQSAYARTDPNIARYGLKTFIGKAVRCFENYIGSLCIFYQADVVLNDEDKELLGIIASALKLQEERRITIDGLRESHELYQFLYEENPSMYFTLNEEGIVLSVNKFGAEQLGYAVKELIGKSVLVVFYDEDLEKVKQQLKACLQNPTQVTSWELRKVRKDGSLMWVKETVRVVRKTNGDLIILVVCEDITDRIREQHEKAQLLKKLAETEKLVTLGQLMTAIAHDIKNPLDIIQTKLYLLQRNLVKDSQDHELNNHFDKIKQQVHRIDNLARDILNYVTPHFINLQPVLINDILNRAIDSLSDHFKQFIKLEKNFEPGLPMILGDSVGLELAFKNLIMNALESIPDKGAIKVVTKRRDDAFVEIRVEDNGEGIQEEDLPKIFEPSFSRKRKRGGTGLGLTICKNIIDQHNGEIQIKSHPMRGTAITVNLRINPAKCSYG